MLLGGFLCTSDKIIKPGQLSYTCISFISLFGISVQVVEFETVDIFVYTKEGGWWSLGILEE